MWHRPAMQSAKPRAGGIFLVLAIAIGIVAGILIGEPSAGFLVGLATGLLILGAMWWTDRRRG
jgi:UDP-N-acetylmuramyl pentapeptide phosphotransferase/UDP-N-acetylglucosamine-1-phosphate transferase